MRCSVVIPCWNEARNLPRTIRSARIAIPGCQVIAAFADSSDETERVSLELADEVVRCGERQRARQMNKGAATAHGELLLFLHADTILPFDANRALNRALARGAVGGGFARRFDSPSLFLRLTCALGEVRCRALGWFLGDQAIFTRSEIFRKLDGFRPLDRFEDLDFARRMARLGNVATLRPGVISSARRFEGEGPWRRTWRDFALTLRYLKGDPLATSGEARLKHAV